MLHGTYKNLEDLIQISNEGLVSSEIIGERRTKYPSCVCVWNLKKNYFLKDYIIFYSGATIKYSGLLIDNEYSQEIKTAIIPYNEMPNINDILSKNPCRIWSMEQTKEARFMPSLSQNMVKIGIIFNTEHKLIRNLIERGAILNANIVDDTVVKDFVTLIIIINL